MRIFIITGPSGVGKSHLTRELMKLNISLLPVYTDRIRRPSETESVDRVYLSTDEFDKIKDQFFYWFVFGGNQYGYKYHDLEFFKKNNQNCCTNAVPSLLENILEVIPDAIVIHLYTPIDKFSLLYERMYKREILSKSLESERSEKIMKINQRLDHAKKEIQNEAQIEQLIKMNPLSRKFEIIDDGGLYKEVIPYIKSVIQ